MTPVSVDQHCRRGKLSMVTTTTTTDPITGLRDLRPIIHTVDGTKKGTPLKGHIIYRKNIIKK